MNNSIFRTAASREEFLAKSIPQNRIILCAGTMFAVVVEFFNMFRVLFLTDAKLSTLNNQIYFGFYFIYFICSVIFLVLEFGVKMPPAARHRIYMLSASVLLFWHTLFNMYDIYRATFTEHLTLVTTITATTAILVFSALLIVNPVYALCNLGVSCGGFLCFLIIRTGDSGIVINFAITALLCVVIYLARYRHFCIEIRQAQRLKELEQELSKTRQEFRLSIEQYELIHEQDNYVTFEWDLKKDTILFSKEWLQYFDESERISNFAEFVRGMRSMSSEQKQTLLACMEKIRAGVPFQKYDLLLPLKSGEERWFELRVITQKNKLNEPILGVGTLSDVTDRKGKIIQLEKDIQKDLFTGLMNKRAIEHYGETRLKSLKQGETLYALLLDIDDFKDVNDNYGHPVGDLVLKQVAELIRKTAPAGARAGRIGGDEFLVLLVADEPVRFDAYAQDLLLNVSKIRKKGLDMRITCSIGLASATSNTLTYAELYRKTDDAVYQAKQQGKNQVCCIGKSY